MLVIMVIEEIYIVIIIQEMIVEEDIGIIKMLLFYIDACLIKKEKFEDRVIRTPNLLIWNQTRYRCAMPSI